MSEPGDENNPVPVDLGDGLLKMELPKPTDTDTGFEGESQSPPAPAGTGPESVRGTLSPKGEPYDPAVHAYPPEPNPPRGRGAGMWKRHRRKPTNTPASMEDVPNAQYRREAETSARLYAEAHVMMFGPDANIDSPESLVSMTNAWERYFQVNGLKQAPPWAELLLTHASYTHQIVKREKIFPRVKRWGIKIAGLFGIKWSDNDARPDSGKQLQRKDEAGATTRDG